MGEMPSVLREIVEDPIIAASLDGLGKSVSGKPRMVTETLGNYVTRTRVFNPDGSEKSASLLFWEANRDLVLKLRVGLDRDRKPIMAKEVRIQNIMILRAVYDEKGNLRLIQTPSSIDTANLNREHPSWAMALSEDEFSIMGGSPQDGFLKLREILDSPMGIQKSLPYSRHIVDGCNFYLNRLFPSRGYKLLVPPTSRSSGISFEVPRFAESPEKVWSKIKGTEDECLGCCKVAKINVSFIAPRT